MDYLHLVEHDQLDSFCSAFPWSSLLDGDFDDVQPTVWLGKWCVYRTHVMSFPIQARRAHTRHCTTTRWAGICTRSWEEASSGYSCHPEVDYCSLPYWITVPSQARPRRIDWIDIRHWAPLGLPTRILPYTRNWMQWVYRTLLTLSPTIIQLGDPSLLSSIDGIRVFTLLPGDILFVPPLWWHAVCCVDEHRYTVVTSSTPIDNWLTATRPPSRSPVISGWANDPIWPIQ